MTLPPSDPNWGNGSDPNWWNEHWTDTPTPPPGETPPSPVDYGDMTVDEKQKQFEQLQQADTGGMLSTELQKLEPTHAPIDWTQGPAAMAQQKLGYMPTYWENPAAVIRWHNVIAANPDGVVLPTGMDASQIEQAYNWLKFRNGDAPATQWKYLDANDPGRSFLQGLQTPPDNMLMPHEAQFYSTAAQAQVQQQQQAATTAAQDWTKPDFNWQGLSIAQKQAILANPNFNMHDVTQSQQGLIFSDPTFDALRAKLPAWQQTYYSAFSNPATSPAIQAVAMGIPAVASGNLLGAALSTGGMLAMGYGSQLEQWGKQQHSDLGDAAALIGGIANGFGTGLMWGAQKTQQVMGVAFDAWKWNAKMISDPAHAAEIRQEWINQTGSGTDDLEGLWAAETGKDIKTLSPGAQKGYAYWESQKAFYTTRPGAFALMDAVMKGLHSLGIGEATTPQNAVYVLGDGQPQTVQAGYTLADAQKRILNGESTDSVMADFTREYGISGQVSNLMGTMIFNPLNAAPEIIGKGHAAWAESSADAAEAAGNDARAAIENVKAQAYEEKPGMTGMWGGGKGLLSSAASKAFATLIRSQGDVPWSDIVGEMTPNERFMAGLTPDGELAELQPSKPGWINLMKNLTPASKGLISAHMMGDNIALMMNALPEDSGIADNTLQLMKSIGARDFQTVRDMGASVMDNPEVYTHIGAVRDFVPAMEEMAANYDLAETARQRLAQVSTILGDEPKNILKNFTDGDPTADFNSLVEKAQSSNDPAAKAFLERVTSGQETADTLAAKFKILQENPGFVSPEAFKGLVYDKFYEHMGNWGADYFNIPKDSQFMEAFRLMKGAQSIAMLNFSPSYMITHLLNTRLNMAAEGVFGFTLSKDLDANIQNELGFTPSKWGTTASEVTGEAMTSDVKSADQIIRAAQHGEGPVTTAADAVSTLQRKAGIFNRLANATTQNSAKQMLWSAYEGFYGKNWQAGLGFDKMPATLETSLRNAGIDPEVVYQNIQGMTGNDFSKLMNGVTTRTVESYVNDAAKALNMDPADATEMLSKLGVLDDLRERLANAKTPDQVKAAIDAVNQKAQDTIDIRRAQELRGEAEHIGNSVKAEGPAGALNVWNELVLDDFERKVDNDRIWDEAYGDNQNATNQALKNQRLHQAAMENQDLWRRTQANAAVKMQGVIEGLGLDDEFKRTFLKNVIDQNDTLTKFFEEKNAAVDQFYKTDYGDDYDASSRDWNKLETEYNEKYRQAQQHVMSIQDQMDEAFAKEHARAFGGLIGNDPAYAAALQWRHGIAQLTNDMLARVSAFRDTLVGKSAADRMTAWEGFKPEYMQMWRDRAAANLDGANKLYKFDQVTPEVLNQAQTELKAQAAQVEQQAQAVRDIAAKFEQHPTPKAETATQPALTEQPPEAGVPGEQSTAPQPETVRGIAGQNGIPSANDAGQPISGSDQHILNTIRKYGEGDARNITDLSQATPEMAQQAFEARQKIQDMQTKMTGMLQPPDAVNRRIPAYQQLRDMFPTLSDADKAQALGWILDKTMVDPISGLDTIYAKALEPAEAPKGMVHYGIDLNGLGGVNDHLGHGAGNDFWNMVGDVINQEVKPKGGTAWRVGGDEAGGWLPADQAADIMSRVNDRIKNAVISLEVDGQPVHLKGFTVSYGIGENESAADAALYVDKSSRLELGERAAKGELPRSISAVTDQPGAQGKVPGPDAAASPTEPTPDQVKQQETYKLLESQPVAKLPEILREPVKGILSDMLDETRAGRKVPMLEWIRTHGGISIKDISDLTGESKAQKAWGPGLFSNKGMQVDELVQRLEEEGYITRQDIENPDDNGGINKVTQMIRNELAGRKNFSIQQEDALTQTPDWYKNLTGKNKKATVDAAITRMLNGYDNASMGMDVPALDQKIKTEVFNRLGDLAKQDGDLATVTGHPFDFESFKNELDDLSPRVDTMDVADLNAAKEHLDSLIKTTPVSTPENLTMKWVDLNNKVTNRIETLNDMNTIADANAKAEMDIRAQEAYGEAIMNRNALRDKYIQANPKASPDQVDAWMQVHDRLPSEQAPDSVKTGYDPEELAKVKAEQAQQAPFSEATPTQKQTPPLEEKSISVPATDAIKQIEQETNPTSGDGTTPPQQSKLFQDGGDTPLLPVGGYDQMAGDAPVGKILQDGWEQKVRPLLDAMQESSNKPERTYNFAGFDDDTQKQLNDYLNQVRGQKATMQHQALRYAEMQRDQAIPDYQRQYGLDKYILNPAMPYQFIMTRSGANWLTRVMDHPAYISTLVALRNAANTYQSQMPDRMKGKIFMPMPFLPSWMGGGMYIDPTASLLPMRMFVQPLDSYQNDVNNDANNAKYVLRQWAQDGTLDPTVADTAIKTQTGAAWDRAIQQAKLENNEGDKNAFDYFGTLMSPGLYASIPYYLATGKTLGSGFPNSQLPVTRFGSSMQTALQGTSLEWLGNAAGILAKPEQWLRQAKGLNEFGEYGDYYTDRQLADMAAEGKYAPKDVQQAMIERSGPIFDEATNRVRQELMMKEPGIAPIYGALHGATLDKVVESLLPSLFPGGILPPGEMAYKGLKNEYSLAWDKYSNGDKKALSDFFDAHPEYETRLALRDDAPTRLEQFLKSNIWDAYGKLGPTDKKNVDSIMGPDFQNFLQANKANPGQEFSTDQLAQWARMLNASVPNVPATQPAAGTTAAQPVNPINPMNPQVTQITDQFFKQRTEKFPGYYMLQQGYYSLPTSERAAYLLRFPQLKDYFDWKAKYTENYPQLKNVFNGNVFKTMDFSSWSPVLMNYVGNYALTGQRMPSGATALLKQYWTMQGQPYGDFQSWLDSDVVPALNNQMLPMNGQP